MPDERKPRLVGINHVALEVADIDAALDFYRRFFAFELRGRSEDHAFIDMGDQFLALTRSDRPTRDGARHFGLVVDDREGLRAKLAEAGVETLTERRLDFLDPWGNRIEVVGYADIQFLKSRQVLRHLGLGDLRKTIGAKEELARKGIVPPEDA